MGHLRTLFMLGIVPASMLSPAWAEEAETGSDLFARHCALCHGADGRGAGSLAAAMKIAPADLTQLSARNGGTFPRPKVQDVIRNGGNVLGHGSSAMPAWGFVFSEKFKPEVAKTRIGELADYLESLQRKP